MTSRWKLQFGDGEEAEGGMSIHQVMDLSLRHGSPKRVWGSGQRMTQDTGKPIPDVQRLGSLSLAGLNLAQGGLWL